jgi:hypothetical protein
MSLAGENAALCSDQRGDDEERFFIAAIVGCWPAETSLHRIGSG